MDSERTLDLHNKSSERIGEFLQLKDPFSGERLVPDRPPSSLDHQPDLREGLAYLRNNPDIAVRVLGDTHGEYDIASPAETQYALQGCDSIFLEGIGGADDSFAHDLFWKVGYENKSVQLSRSDYDSLGAHRQHQLRLLGGCKKPIFFPEVPSNGTEYEQDINDLINLTDVLLPYALGGDDHLALAVEINIASTIMMREWYMLAKMGSLMKNFERRTGTRLRRPLIMIGSAHLETLPPKVSGLGLSIEVREARATIRNTPPKPIRHEALRHGDELPVLEAARDGVARLIKHSR